MQEFFVIIRRSMCDGAALHDCNGAMQSFRPHGEPGIYPWKFANSSRKLMFGTGAYGG